MIGFHLSESTLLSTNVFIDLNQFLGWAMWPMGLLFNFSLYLEIYWPHFYYIF